MTWSRILMVIVLLCMCAAPLLAAASLPTVVLGIDRLEQESDEAYWDRLFVQCASWTAAYGEVQAPAKAKLIELGVDPLCHLVPTWLGDGDVRHRVTLEEIIAGVGPSSTPTLLPYVADPNAVLRQRCIYVLGGFDVPEALPALRPLLASETEMLVLPSLIEAIGKRGAEVDGLANEVVVFTTHHDERIRRASAVALGRIGDASAIEALLLLLDDPLFTVREPAQEAIFTIANSYEAWQHQVDTKIVMDNEARTTVAGRMLQLELRLALPALHASAGSPVHRLGWGSPEECIAMLRGVLRVWQHNRELGDEMFAAIPMHFDDPRVEATRRMIVAERRRLREAGT